MLLTFEFNLHKAEYSGNGQRAVKWVCKNVKTIIVCILPIKNTNPGFRSFWFSIYLTMAIRKVRVLGAVKDLKFTYNIQ